MARRRHRACAEISPELADYFHTVAERDESPASLTRHLLTLEALLLDRARRDRLLVSGIIKERAATLLLLAAQRARSRLDLALKLFAFRIPDPWSRTRSLIDALMRQSLQVDINALRVAPTEEILTLQ